MLDNGIFKQKNIGTWWGAFRNLGSYVSFYLFVVNTIVLLINTYILGNMAVYGLPIPMWLIIVITVVVFFVLLVIAMLFEHKYTLPSFMTYWNSQWWSHGNKLPGELSGIQRQLDRIEDTLKNSKREVK